MGTHGGVGGEGTRGGRTQRVGPRQAHPQGASCRREHRFAPAVSTRVDRRGAWRCEWMEGMRHVSGRHVHTRSQRVGGCKGVGGVHVNRVNRRVRCVMVAGASGDASRTTPPAVLQGDAGAPGAAEHLRHASQGYSSWGAQEDGALDGHGTSPCNALCHRLGIALLIARRGGAITLGRLPL